MNIKFKEILVLFLLNLIVFEIIYIILADFAPEYLYEIGESVC